MKECDTRNLKAENYSITPLRDIKKKRLFNLIHQLEESEDILSNVSYGILSDRAVKELFGDELPYTQKLLIETQKNLANLSRKVYERAYSLRLDYFGELVEEMDKILDNEEDSN